MFGDFNNLPKDAAYEWYQHEGNWSNRLIRGDSVKVMASLLAKEGMEGKVQMIYMDPPYGIGFKSNLQVATDDRNTPANTNALPHDPTVVQTFRDTYSNGLNSYLDNLYRNFIQALALLSESGSIFVQIGSENLHRVALVLDEAFGPDSRVATISFKKSGTTTSRTIPEPTDYLLWYAKDKDQVRYHQLFEEQTRAQKLATMTWAAMLELADGTVRSLTDVEHNDPARLPDHARIFTRADLLSQHHSTTGRSEQFTWNEKKYFPRLNEQWKVSHDGLRHMAELERW